MGFKVYLTDNIFGSVDAERDILAAAGADLVVADCRSEDDVVAQCADADGLIVVYTRIGNKALDALKDCRVVVRTGIGVDPIDLDAATAHGVCVANVPDYCVPEVSDHALALILASSRRIVQLDRAVRGGKWSVLQTAPEIEGLEGQVLGIVGLGKIGRRLARNASAIGLRVLAYDPYLDDETAKTVGASLVPLDDLLTQADYVSINAPLTAETHHMISTEQFERMKPAAFLINTSRGPVVDEQALIAALQAGKIAGAGLDVLENEPVPSDSPLLEMSNVILNPHAAYYSRRAYAELHRRVAEEVARVLGGKYPTSLVNPAVKERLQAMGRELAED